MSEQHPDERDSDEMGVQSVPASWELIDFESAFELVSANDRKVPSSEYLPAGLLPVVDQGQQFIGGFTNDASLAIEPGSGLLIFGDHTRVFKPIDFSFAAGADGIKILRPRIASMKYCFYACLSLKFPDKGYARHYSHLRQCRLPVAPQQEQARIVSKIDELFSQIEDGERALARVRKLVERYRQSVLKAAVTGELTREWRETHQGELESGEDLLARILEARRDAWEHAEMGKMKAKGVRPVSRDWKKKYAEPIVPDTRFLSELPKGWVWASVDQLCGLITSGSRGWKEHYAVSGSTFIRAQNIKGDVLNLDDVAFVDLSSVSEGLRTKVSKNDLLVTITGANVTKSALVEHDLADAYVSQHVALVRPVDIDVSAFLFHWIVSPFNGRKQLSEAAYGAGKPGLSLEDVRCVAIALPSRSEQQLICERIAVEMSRIANIVDLALDQVLASKGLRQAILKAAFSGQLVPQDPDDEPASVLLERIAAERAASSSAAGAGKEKSNRRSP